MIVKFYFLYIHSRWDTGRQTHFLCLLIAFADFSLFWRPSWRPKGLGRHDIFTL
jgi:hypothetical protein